MGATATKSQKTGNENVDKTIQKMAVVGAFQSAAGNSSKWNKFKPDNITDYVRKRKFSRQEAYGLHAKQLERDQHKQGQSVLPSDFNEQDENIEYENQLYEIEEDEQEDVIVVNYCVLCSHPTNIQLSGGTCRVCGQVYHRSCIDGSYKYTSDDLEMFDRTNTATGWSCSDCDNILNLLNPHEVEELSTEYDEFSKNKDNCVCLEAYLLSKRRNWENTHSGPMPKEEETFQKLQFKLLDVDGSGNIDYWEFVKNDGCKKLARRSKEDLVKMLTSLEKKSARRVYDALDANRCDVITSHEARMRFRNWYSYVDKASNQLSVSARDKKKKATAVPLRPVASCTSEQYVTQQTNQIVIDAYHDQDRLAAWREYLREQALYILSSRPNKVNRKQ